MCNDFILFWASLFQEFCNSLSTLPADAPGVGGMEGGGHGVPENKNPTRCWEISPIVMSYIAYTSAIYIFNIHETLYMVLGSDPSFPASLNVHSSMNHSTPNRSPDSVLCKKSHVGRTAFSRELSLEKLTRTDSTLGLHVGCAKGRRSRGRVDYLQP